MSTAKPRARALGLPLAGTPGSWNAITDVPGVEVGFSTLHEIAGKPGDRQILTGVTAILPRGRVLAALDHGRLLELLREYRRMPEPPRNPGAS